MDSESNVIFIPALAPALNEEVLKDLFIKFGPITRVTIKDGERRYGFVHFLNHESYEKAFASPTFYNGRPLIIKPGKRNHYKPDQIKTSRLEKTAIVTPTRLQNKDLRVAYVENPVSFYAHEVSDVKKVEKMCTELQEYCSLIAQKVTTPTHLNKIYACKSPEDGAWYRSRVETRDGASIQVQLIDFGNKEVLNTDDLLELNAELSQLPPLASYYQMRGLKPTTSNRASLTWVEGMNWLKAKLQDKTIQTRIENGRYVEVFQNGSCINTMMLSHSSKLWQNSPVGPQLQPQPQGQGQLRGGGSGYRELEEQCAGLRKEVQGYTALQEEHSALKKATEEFKRRPVNSQLESLLTALQHLKESRYFKVRPEQQLQPVIAMVTAADRVTVGSVEVGQVQRAVQDLDAQQEEIAKCADRQALEPLCLERDQRRLAFYTAICVFEELLDKLPLDARRQALQEHKTLLRDEYASYLNTKNEEVEFNSFLEKFQEWKTAKDEKLEELQNGSDACSSALMAATNHLTQLLDLQNAVNEQPDIEDFDKLIRDCQVSFKKETKEMELLQEKGEPALLSTMVSSLLAQMQVELKVIDWLQSELSQQYGQTKATIEPWLGTKPDLGPINKVRSSLKAVKSELRHSLADRSDLVESEEVDPEQIGEFDQRLDLLLLKLHALFVSEEDHLRQLSSFTYHFPELPLQYPSLGIENYLASGGLIKLSREPEHYSVTESLGKKVEQSTFNGVPCVLKSYSLDEENVTQKDIAEKCDYFNIGSPYLLSVEALFFTKRLGYAQFPFMENGSLAKFVEEEGKVDEEDLYHILHCVLKGIAALHDNKTVHASIHPANVLLRDRNSAVLADFDFGKTPEERAKRVYTTPAGLKFQSPEKLPSVQADMFNFGLLMLWMHNPGTTSAQSKPQTSNEALHMVVTQLLKPMPMLRPSASTTLMMPYFTNPPVKKVPTIESTSEPDNNNHYDQKFVGENGEELNNIKPAEDDDHLDIISNAINNQADEEEFFEEFLKTEEEKDQKNFGNVTEDGTEL